ncbi:adenine phosphoribosyltransferase [Candidatus Hydrogenedentota bacterium]
MADIKSLIRSVPDFPKPGIDFKDITTLLKDGPAFAESIDLMAARYEGKQIDAIVCAEARGFIFGAALAYKLGVGVVPVRKPGKLPAETYSVTYDLEYGADTLEIHKDALDAGQRVLLCDDLLATGGTIAGTVELLKEFDVEIVEIAFLIELDFLNGREKLPGQNVFSLIEY